MVRVLVDYEECKHIWNKKNRYNGGNAFTTKQQMISYAAKKFGISAAGHPELRDYATKFLKEEEEGGK